MSAYTHHFLKIGRYQPNLEERGPETGEDHN